MYFTYLSNALVSAAAITNATARKTQHNTFISHCSRGWTSKIKVLAGLASPEASLKSWARAAANEAGLWTEGLPPFQGSGSRVPFGQGLKPLTQGPSSERASPMGCLGALGKGG